MPIRRGRTVKPVDVGPESLPFFDISRVPVEPIALPVDPAMLMDLAHQVLGQKVNYRLAQWAGGLVVLKYERPMIKLRASGRMLCPPEPPAVIEGAQVDVSFLASVLVDKYVHQLPLSRQHQRLVDAGFTLTQPWLTLLVTQAASLLAPIYQAQLASIAGSAIKYLDKKPVKGVRHGPGKPKGGFYWPTYGDQDEICFLFCETQDIRDIEALLGAAAEADVDTNTPPLHDALGSYRRFCAKMALDRAQCWTQLRQEFLAARYRERITEEGLTLIEAVHALEAEMHANNIKGAKKKAVRQTRGRELVDQFFAWVDATFADRPLQPGGRLTSALVYARERQPGLRSFLADPALAIDAATHVRARRSVLPEPLNWPYAWTEVGARQSAVLQSLLTTCRLQDVNPYDYLVDVLLRLPQHPVAELGELTPRRWQNYLKTHFDNTPLRSDMQRQR